MFRFAHTYYFYLFALIPLFTLLFFYFMIWRKRAAMRFGDWNITRQLVPDYSFRKPVVKFVGLMMVMALLILSLANPQTGSRLEKVKRKGIDLMICLDVSNSMMAQDIKPDRLERAKQAITRLIDNLDGDRIGIIVFAGKAYTQLPITTDYAAAKMFISTISPGIVPVQGTAIAQAIETASGSFGESKHNKAIIVITDGEDHEGSVLEQTEAAVQKGIVIYTIGMGLPEGVPIPVYNGNVQIGYKKDENGQTVMSKLDETLLQRVASVGKGMYVRATTSETGLNKVFDDIARIQKSEIEEKQFSDYESRFQYFTGLALLILLLDLFIFERKTRWLRRFRPFEKTLVVLLLLIVSPQVFAQKENTLLRKGNARFEKGDYKEAEKDYRKALEINKESLPGQFNLGTAVYRNNNFDESIKLYGNLADRKTSKDVQAKIYHNLGNSLLQSKEYEKSIAAYKNSLINDPSNRDTKYNLEYARMMLKQQQQQQQNKDNQDKKDDKKDQKQDQKQDQQDNKNQQQPPQDQKKISKDDAERMLEALKNDEKKTMDKVKKQKAKVQVVGVEKDW